MTFSNKLYFAFPLFLFVSFCSVECMNKHRRPKIVYKNSFHKSRRSKEQINYQKRKEIQRLKDIERQKTKMNKKAEEVLLSQIVDEMLRNIISFAMQKYSCCKENLSPDSLLEKWIPAVLTIKRSVITAIILLFFVFPGAEGVVLEMQGGRPVPWEDWKIPVTKQYENGNTNHFTINCKRTQLNEAVTKSILMKEINLPNCKKICGARIDQACGFYSEIYNYHENQEGTCVKHTTNTAPEDKHDLIKILEELRQLSERNKMLQLERLKDAETARIALFNYAAELFSKATLFNAFKKPLQKAVSKLLMKATLKTIKQKTKEYQSAYCNNKKKRYENCCFPEMLKALKPFAGLSVFDVSSLHDGANYENVKDIGVLSGDHESVKAILEKIDRYAHTFLCNTDYGRFLCVSNQ